jgi:uncharacterized protein (DUF1800 family)
MPKSLIRMTFAIAAILVGAAHAQGNATTEAAWRATSRLGYGPTSETLATIERAGGARAWALQQVDAAYAASQQAPAIPARLNQFNQPLDQIFAEFMKEREARKAGEQTLQKSPAGGRAAETGKIVFSREAAREAAAWRIMACSSPDTENPLLARMTEFWFNHLNVFSGKGPVRPFVGHYEINVIRAHALGRFEDLLLASARHPAMLFYLDQAQSVAEGRQGYRGNARGLNENYARELMELHTLGVDGGYSQTDVRELARILTGWTVAPRRPTGFRFNAAMHDTGEKRLLGVRFAGQGNTEGEEAIRMLARHPATARRIANRLANFFVADQAPPQLVDRLAQRFSATQGDIRATLVTLLESAEFWNADQRLFKTPLDYVCSLLTALGGTQEPAEIARALGFLSSAGQGVHAWQTPDGYRTDAATWLSPEALTRRADLAMVFGRRAAEPAFLKAFLDPETLTRIAREPPQLRTGLMLASPFFMSK